MYNNKMYNNKMYNNKMYNYIILSSSLFGSVYLFSTSLKLINRTLLENKKIPHTLILINGLTFGFSGSILLYLYYSNPHQISFNFC
jgi:hypothetical protein